MLWVQALRFVTGVTFSAHEIETSGEVDTEEALNGNWLTQPGWQEDNAMRVRLQKHQDGQ